MVLRGASVLRAHELRAAQEEADEAGSAHHCLVENACSDQFSITWEAGLWINLQGGLVCPGTVSGQDDHQGSWMLGGRKTSLLCKCAS